MKKNVLTLLFFFLFLSSLPGLWAQAQEAPIDGAAVEAVIGGEGEAPTVAEIQALLRALEDPRTRQQLIEQLRLLNRAGETVGVVAPTELAGPGAVTAAQTAAPAEPPAEPAPAAEAVNETALVGDTQVQTATSELLQAISRRLEGFGDTALLVMDDLNEVPQLWDWLLLQATNPLSHRLWLDVLTNLALILGLGYAAFTVMLLLLRRPHKALSQRPGRSLLARAMLLVVLLILDLLPIVAFALTAYLTLGLVDPREITRLVALAWINAAIIVRLVLAVERLIFAPHAAALRLLDISDESAHYADIWTRRLTFTTVYGYLALQAAWLLGLPGSAYQAMLRLLGFVVMVMVIVLIVQNRARVARLIRGRYDEGYWSPFKLVRNRLSQIWFLPAILYVLVLYAIWALAITGGFLFLLQATLVTLGILALAYLVLRVLAQLFERGFQISPELKQRFPGLEARANRYIPTLHTLCRWLVNIIALLAILQAWGMDTFEWLASPPGKILTATALSIIGIVIGSFAVWEITSSVIESYLAEKDRYGRVRVRSARTKTLLTVIRNFLFLLLLIVAVLLILAELGVNIAPLLAGAGVLGVAIGFGSQKLVQDVITGVFILFEDLVSVGDVVDVGGKAGLVEAVTIRNIKLRDLSGTVHTIPYSAISTISNLTKDFSFYLMDIGVAYRENVDQVMEVLKALGREMQSDPEYGPRILEPLEILGVDAFADSAVVIKARIKTLPIQQWAIGREFNRRMKNRFDELGIEIPFPHTTLYFGEDRQGRAPAARVRMEPSLETRSKPAGMLERPVVNAPSQSG